jgi:predicted O-linked N-acetylglucosamine transferase (SPINDLY family)
MASERLSGLRTLAGATSADLLQRASSLQEKGELDGALSCYEEALRSQPDLIDALYNRGIILLMRGRHAEALASFERAIAVSPHLDLAFNNRGVALRALGRNEEAIASFRRALALNPDSPNALHNRAETLAKAGRLQEAIRDFDELVKRQPADPTLWTRRGDALLRSGQLERARESFEQAARLRPDDLFALNQQANLQLEAHRPAEALAIFERMLTAAPEDFHALNGRGLALRALGRADDALRSFDHALQIQPDSPEALSNRGTALIMLGRDTEALESLDRALAIRPDLRPALGNRGTVLLRLNRTAEALASYNACLALAPHNAEMLYNRGNALLALRRMKEAAESYEQALQVQPDLREALMNLGVVHTDCQHHEKATQCFTRLVELDAHYEYALGNLLFSRLNCADWTHWQELSERLAHAIGQGQRVSFPFPSLSFAPSAPLQLRCARTYVADRSRPEANVLYRGERYVHDRIRLAYLSADFREHAVAHLAAGLFERHDRAHFETIAISLIPHPQASPMRQRLRAAFDQFHEVSARSDRGAAELLRGLEVDIAVDLTGYTTGGRLGILGFRPAPVQVSYLGYPGTLGASYVDYLIADPVVVPRGEETAYAERVVRLPHCYLPNDASTPPPAASTALTRAAAGLPQSGFVFCGFNNTYKINPAMFDIWMRLLHQIPNSILWLRTVEPAVTANLRREATARGIAPERLLFAPYVTDKMQHLERYALVDLFLDTLPYNAHATATDALRAGVPVLTCRGTTFAGRVAASLLSALDMPELITSSLEEYESLALRLASSPAGLAAVRAKLAEHGRTRPLFDAELYRRHLESAFQAMWERHQRGQPPATFDVVSSVPVGAVSAVSASRIIPSSR